MVHYHDVTHAGRPHHFDIVTRCYYIQSSYWRTIQGVIKKMERRSHNTLSKFEDLSWSAFIASLCLIWLHAAQGHRLDTPESTWECEFSNLLLTVVAKHQGHTGKGPETASILTASAPSLQWDPDGINREKRGVTYRCLCRQKRSESAILQSGWVSWLVLSQLGTS